MGKASRGKRERRARKPFDQEKRGRVFEDRIAWIHRAIDEGAIVEARDRLRDRASGTLREQDVVLELRAGHFRVLTIIEAKDHKRKIDVGYIDGLPTRRADLGADIIAIASTGGFTPAAIAKAQAHNIRLFTYREDPDPSHWPNWMQARTLGASFEIRSSMTATADCAPEPGAPEPSDLVLDGSEQLRGFTNQLLKGSPIQRVPGADESHFEFTFARPVWLRQATGAPHLIERLRASVTHRDEVHEFPLKRFVYSDVVSGEPITDVFVAEGAVAGEPIWVEQLGIPTDDGYRLSTRFVGAVTGEILSAQVFATVTSLGADDDSTG